MPIVIQESPLQPNTDFLLILRHIERLDKLKLDTESILDEKKLPKQFEVRNFKFPKTDTPEEMSKVLQKELE